MAINCRLEKSLTKDNACGYSLPEVKDIYLANFGDITAAPVDYDCESGVTISGITAVTSADTFFHIEPAKNSVTFTDELVVEDNGNKYRTHTITFNLSGKYDKNMVCPVDALAVGRFFVVVVTADGEWLALGRSTGLEASAQSISGGGDTNGVSVTLSANVTETATPLSPAAVTQLKALVKA